MRLPLPLLYTTASAVLLMSNPIHGFSSIVTARGTRTRCVIGIGIPHPRVDSTSLPPSNGRSNTATALATSFNDEDISGETSVSPIDTLIDTIQSNPTRSIYFSLLMTLCGAALGPFLDSYHSLFGVLSYDTPLVFPILSGKLVEGGPELLTCVTTYWVPPLFGLAGFLIGWLYVGLDAIFDSGTSNNPEVHHQQQLYPSVPKVLIGISYFTFQYWLSGILFAHGVNRTSIMVLMSTLAAGGFFALDGTLSGFITSAATAIGGPLIEVGLISSLPGSWTYHYNDAGETGFFPLWIIPVYFLGGPANGNLARAFWNALGDDKSDAKDQELVPSLPKRVPCDVCNGTRAAKCPNCDDGTYITYGERVICKACRGKGRVICRSCFSKYGDDPNDIENIRRIMDQIPD